MQLEVIKSRVQLLAQAAAVLAVISYAVGFLTISIHHGYFGISQVSLLRPKIVSAGILFLVFMGLPVQQAARVYGFWGLGDTPNNKAGIEASGKSPLYMPLLRALSFLVGAIAISVVIRPFLVDYPPNILALLTWTLVSVAAITAVIIFVRRRGNQNPMISATLLLLAISLLFVAVWRMRDPGLAILLGWFCWSALMTHSLKEAIEEPEKLRTRDWHLWATNSVATVALFAIFVYPRVGSAFGGGAPVPVTLEVTDKNVSGNTPMMRVWLIDETDMGFYTIESKESKKAIFIPRGSVSAIYFGDQTIDLNLKPKE